MIERIEVFFLAKESIEWRKCLALVVELERL